MRPFSPLSVLFLGLLTLPLTAQRRQITVDQLWRQRTFAVRTVNAVNWLADSADASGRYFSALVGDPTAGVNHVVRVDVTTGATVDTLINGRALAAANDTAARFTDYTFSADGQQVLLLTDRQKIYRHSFTARYFLFDRRSGRVQPLSAGGPQQYATFSPDGQRVAFVRDNNLFYAEPATGREVAVTTTGQPNALIHGSTDWVYEEEFGFWKGFFWSPDGRRLAYYTFDEREVPEYTLQRWGGRYPQQESFKYPKAGSVNAKVGVTVYQLDNGRHVPLALGDETDQYVPRVGWTQAPATVWLYRLNRLQNHLELIHYDATTGRGQVVHQERDDAYVDVEATDHLTYLDDGKQMVLTSEQSGYNHLYLYTTDGTCRRALTRGDWEVDQLLDVDEEGGWVYYTSTEAGPTERQLYRVNLKGKKKERLTQGAGWHQIDAGPGFRYYLDQYSTLNQPPTTTLYRQNGTPVKVVEDNAALRDTLAKFGLSPAGFFTFAPAPERTLNGWMIRPPDFDSTRRYPVLMYVYGGPGSQTVKNQWLGANYLWFQLLAQRGYVVVSVDNRGTGGRGAAFKKQTYAQLGKLEYEDQLDAARYLKTLPYVDGDRVGIWGWSYGGYMTLLALTRGGDVFKAGIAVAPVTTWRFYDTIYTERYLKTPQQNPEGYDDNSPLTYADQLKASLLLVHGTGDDNVHFQNAVFMQNALVAAGKQFDSFYYPNRDHSIGDAPARAHLYQMMTNFLLEKL